MEQLERRRNVSGWLSYRRVSSSQQHAAICDGILLETCCVDEKGVFYMKLQAKIVLDKNKRIVGAYFTDDPTISEFDKDVNGVEEVGVERLPDVGLINFKYIDGEYVYDPLIMTETEKEILESSVDCEYRMMLLEMGLTE